MNEMTDRAFIRHWYAMRGVGCLFAFSMGRFCYAALHILKVAIATFPRFLASEGIFERHTRRF